MTPDLGLALSGGGSRAAAFHRGTLQALLDLGLVERVQTISAVSGGSVFAASWMAARARDRSDADFLAWMHERLAVGFIRPTIASWRIVKWLWRSRTEALADTFDRLLFADVALRDLPVHPLLCLNTTVLGNASAGRFSRDGYSGDGVGERTADGGYPVVDIPGVTLGFATAASAAFPFALPPLAIRSSRIGVPLTGALAGHARLYLTDGGILENLGVERLLHSARFGTRHVLVSDAGVHDRPWQPSLVGQVKSAAAYGLSSQILDRLLALMNDKQNKSMRELLYARLLPDAESNDGRVMLFARLASDWSSLHVRDGVNLDTARAHYDAMGGDRGVAIANAVSTSFTGLSAEVLRVLELHARWQVHAAVALYGDALVSRPSASGR